MTNLYFYAYNFGSFSKTIYFSQKLSNPHNPPTPLHHCWTGNPVLPPSHLAIQPTSAIQRQTKVAAGARLEEVARRCQELLFMITEQEPALEFVLLHIYYYIFISDFLGQGSKGVLLDQSSLIVWLYVQGQGQARLHWPEHPDCQRLNCSLIVFFNIYYYVDLPCPPKNLCYYLDIETTQSFLDNSSGPQSNAINSNL